MAIGRLVEAAANGGFGGLYADETFRRLKADPDDPNALFALAVVPAERRRGLGSALLLRSARWIADAGMDTAYLSVNVANPDALTIYELAGYRSVQVYRGYGLRLA